MWLFEQFKSQAERYKDISVDLASLIEDAVERFGRWDAAAGPMAKATRSLHEDGMDADSADEDPEDGEDDDMVSRALFWLILFANRCSRRLQAPCQ